jgi:hypothetical protein
MSKYDSQIQAMLNQKAAIEAGEIPASAIERNFDNLVELRVNAEIARLEREIMNKCRSKAVNEDDDYLLMSDDYQKIMREKKL